jgi:hypothetical protein
MIPMQMAILLTVTAGTFNDTGRRNNNCCRWKYTYQSATGLLEQQILMYMHCQRQATATGTVTFTVEAARKTL